MGRDGLCQYVLAAAARALLGRTLGAGDDANPDVVVLSFDTWQRHFAADPAIVGTALEFRAGALLAPIPPRLLTVVGVLPADFEFPTGRLDFYTPIALDPSRRSPQVTMIGRLAPGVSIEAAMRGDESHGHRDPPAVARQRDAPYRCRDSRCRVSKIKRFKACGPLFACCSWPSSSF